MKKRVSDAARAGQMRWDGMTKKQISAHQLKIASLPRTQKRCFCGEESMLRAASRYFDCCRRAGIIELNLERKRELSNERRTKETEGRT